MFQKIGQKPTNKLLYIPFNNRAIQVTWCTELERQPLSQALSPFHPRRERRESLGSSLLIRELRREDMPRALVYSMSTFCLVCQYFDFSRHRRPHIKIQCAIERLRSSGRCPPKVHELEAELGKRKMRSRLEYEEHEVAGTTYNRELC